jgi:hypothetical protein
MGSLATDDIEEFLQRLGDRYLHPATIYLLGGSALCFLGNPRRTVDIDYTVEPAADALVVEIESLADEMQLELEAVPIEEFVPLPDGSVERHQWIGQFRELRVYVYDPYTIALSKLSRGFETDLQDVVFLLRQRIITLTELTRYVEAALPQAWDFDINPADLRLYFDEVNRLLQS